MDLSHGFCYMDAERGVAVQDGDWNLVSGHLAVEVPFHEALL